MSPYEVKTEQFNGPLDKLLQLIEEKQLDVTQVSMAAVTADFLEYIKGFGEDVEPATLSDFLVVASRLVLIKSKVLLPSLELTQDEEHDIHDLETRLQLYREFKKAGEHVSALWNKKTVSLSRPVLMSLGDTPVFYPPPELVVADMVNAMRKLFETLKSLLPDASQKIKRTVISLEKKMEELVGRLHEAVTHSFRSISQAKPREEIVVLFLAILHLLKDKVIHVEQESQFGDIMLKKS